MEVVISLLLVNLIFIFSYIFSYIYNYIDNYRGSISISINYLTLKSLKHYSISINISDNTRQRCILLYNKLRKNLIKNIIQEYEKTGYFWELYDDSNGSGIGKDSFTGWTSLLINIITESY